MTVRANGKTPPRRGTRPPNRRALIIEAATELFYERGYAQVAMGDIADSVSIGPSALYRHFSGKQDLLREVLAVGFAPVLDAMTALDVGDSAGAIAQLCAGALDHRELGLLWRREVRHLTISDAADMQTTLLGIGNLLAQRIRDVHPELEPAAAALSARIVSATLTSPSFHRLELPRAEYLELLTNMVDTVLATPLPVGLADPRPAEPVGRLVPAARREALLTQAIRMFARRGYSAVGLEDIGAGVGISGPSVYNHFGSKQEILVTAVARCAAALLAELDFVYDVAATPDEALGLLIHSYVQFAGRHHDVIGLLITDHMHLPQAERAAAYRDRREYLGEWAHLLRSHHPELDPVSAQIRIQAVLAIVNDTAMAGHLRADPAVADAVERICSRLLFVGAD